MGKRTDAKGDGSELGPKFFSAFCTANRKGLKGLPICALDKTGRWVKKEVLKGGHLVMYQTFSGTGATHTS